MVTSCTGPPRPAKWWWCRRGQWRLASNGSGFGATQRHSRQAGGGGSRQSRLMRLYDDVLGPKGVTVAQVLLTHADIQSRTRYLNARRAIAQLIEHRALPIINENDTVSVEELKFGDNDTLAGMAVDPSRRSCSSS